MKDRSPRETPAHWSKDFVEHLRTVHFALIAVAGALILIVISARPYKPSVALRQINEIIELKRMYTLELVRTWADHFMAFAPPDIPGVKPALGEVRDVSLSDQILDGTLHYTDGSKRQPETYSFRLPKQAVYYIAYPGLARQEEFAQRLADFKTWWNLLQKKNYWQIKFIPESIYAYAPVEDGSGKVIGYIKPENVHTVAAGQIELLLRPEPTNPKTPYLFPAPSEMDIPFSYSGSLGAKSLLTVHFVVQSYSAGELNSEQIVQIFPNWKPTSFDQCFADLDQATRQLESLEFEDIEKIIAQDAGQRGEVFEAFGLKFPAEQVTFWGIIVTLGVQIYFLLYLKQLHGKLQTDDAGWDVPWIGMNQSLPAQYLFFTSVVLLPSAAVAILGGRATTELLNQYFVRTPHFVRLAVRINDISFLDKAAACAFLVSFLATVFLAQRSWRYRPRIPNQAASCSPQRFE